MKRFFLLFLLIIIFGGLGAGIVIYGERSVPTMTVSPDTPFASLATEFTVTVQDDGRGLKDIEVLLVKDNSTRSVFTRAFGPDQHTWSGSFTLGKDLGKEGPFELMVTCSDRSLNHWGKGNTARVQRSMIFDATPPRVTIDSMHHNVRRGGTGVIRYDLSEPVRKTGVTVGQDFFPGYQTEKGDYLCFFAFPFNAVKGQDTPTLMAEDKAGNMLQTGFRNHIIGKRFRKDIIRLPQSFLDAKMPQFRNLYPGETDNLEIFLKVNNEIRTKNRNALKSIGAETSREVLWNGPFIRLPRAASRARFADSRDYLYKGKKVDHQTHLGQDLASTAKAEVPAGNTGTVVYADFMGIYGNVIILDHGFGLQSLYAHLSSMDVAVGDRVTKGEIIGRTGATGMAGGDHLHFGMIVSGIPVDPLEWWDAHWIKDNVADRIR